MDFLPELALDAELFLAVFFLLAVLLLRRLPPVSARSAARAAALSRLAARRVSTALLTGFLPLAEESPTMAPATPPAMAPTGPPTIEPRTAPVIPPAACLVRDTFLPDVPLDLPDEPPLLPEFRLETVPVVFLEA